MKALRHRHYGSASAHARVFGKDILSSCSQVRWSFCDASHVFVLPISTCDVRNMWGCGRPRRRPQEGRMVAHRKKYSVHVTALCMHGFAGMQGCGCHLERRDSVPLCLLLLAQTRSCIASRSPGHTFTAVWGQGCWLGQQEVKHSSEISGNSFVLGIFVEPQVDAAPTIL